MNINSILLVGQKIYEEMNKFCRRHESNFENVDTTFSYSNCDKFSF